MTIEEFRQEYGEIEEFVLWSDFPEKLTDEEVKIFCKENPFWADFFKPRLEERGIVL